MINVDITSTTTSPNVIFDVELTCLLRNKVIVEGTLKDKKSFVCSVYGCPNAIPNDNTGVQYYSFPKSPELADLWVQLTGWPKEEINLKTAKVCSIHFSSNESFTLFVTQSNEILYRKLKNDAVPTLFLPHVQANAENLDENMTQVLLYIEKDTNNDDVILTIREKDGTLQVNQQHSEENEVEDFTIDDKELVEILSGRKEEISLEGSDVKEKFQERGGTTLKNAERPTTSQAKPDTNTEKNKSHKHYLRCAKLPTTSQAIPDTNIDKTKSHTHYLKNTELPTTSQAVPDINIENTKGHKHIRVLLAEQRNLQERLEKQQKAQYELRETLHKLRHKESVVDTRYNALSKKIIKEKSGGYTSKTLLEKIFSPAQLKILMGRRKTYWANEDMCVGYTILHLSNKRCYNYIKDKMKYPLVGLSSLERWVMDSRKKKKRNQSKNTHNNVVIGSSVNDIVEEVAMKVEEHDNGLENNAES